MDSPKTAPARVHRAEAVTPKDEAALKSALGAGTPIEELTPAPERPAFNQLEGKTPVDDLVGMLHTRPDPFAPDAEILPLTKEFVDPEDPDFHAEVYRQLTAEIDTLTGALIERQNENLSGTFDLEALMTDADSVKALISRIEAIDGGALNEILGLVTMFRRLAPHPSSDTTLLPLDVFRAMDLADAGKLDALRALIDWRV